MFLIFVGFFFHFSLNFSAHFILKYFIIWTHYFEIVLFCKWNREIFEVYLVSSFFVVLINWIKLSHFLDFWIRKCFCFFWAFIFFCLNFSIHFILKYFIVRTHYFVTVLFCNWKLEIFIVNFYFFLMLMNLIEFPLLLNCVIKNVCSISKEKLTLCLKLFWMQYDLFWILYLLVSVCFLHL